jgi:hypothetical protein
MLELGSGSLGQMTPDYAAPHAVRRHRGGSDRQRPV